VIKFPSKRGERGGPALSLYQEEEKGKGPQTLKRGLSSKGEGKKRKTPTMSHSSMLHKKGPYLLYDQRERGGERKEEGVSSTQVLCQLPGKKGNERELVLRKGGKGKSDFTTSACCRKRRKKKGRMINTTTDYD